MASAWSWAAIPGEEPELRPNWLSSIYLAMIVWAVRLRALKLLPASMNLIIKRVVLLFLPTMRKFASIFVFAAIRISLNKVFSLPLWTLLSFIIKNMRFPSEILPIVSVDAGISWMLSIRIGTPYCLEMKHVKICRVRVIMRIRSELMQEINCDFFFWMSESTHVTIVARLNSPWVALAKLHLVFFRMIKFFNSIMSFRATITKVALVTRLGWKYIGAYLWCIGSKSPPSILLGLMIKKAFLWIVLICELAWLSFEVEEINEGNRIITLEHLMTADIAASLIELIKAAAYCNRVNTGTRLLRWLMIGSHLLNSMRRASSDFIKWSRYPYRILMIEWLAMMNSLIFVGVRCGAHSLIELWCGHLFTCFDLIRSYSWIFLGIERLWSKSPLLRILRSINLGWHLQLNRMKDVDCSIASTLSTPRSVVSSAGCIVYLGHWQKAAIVSDLRWGPNLLVWVCIWA